MKNFKKLLSIALGTALMITTMTGCGSSQNRLDKIKASGKLCWQPALTLLRWNLRT